MVHQVKLRERDAVLIVSKRLPVTLSGIGDVLGRALGEVYRQLGATGAEADGPPFVIYHGHPVSDEPFDIDICAPVSRVIDPPGGWQIQELPAGSFVSLLHVGPYETLGVAYDTLAEWVRAHELVMAGPPREVYLSEPGTPPEEVNTVVEFPVIRAQ